jgi:hypothetical protein
MLAVDRRRKRQRFVEHQTIGFWFESMSQFFPSVGLFASWILTSSVTSARRY